MKRLLPIPLSLELAAAALIALVITNAATGLFFRMAWDGSVERRFQTEFAKRAASAATAVLAAPDAASRERLLRALTGVGQRVSLSSAPAARSGGRDDAALIAQLLAIEPSLAGLDIRMEDHGPRPRWRRHDMVQGTVRGIAVLTLSVRQPDGTWINAEFDLPVPFDPTYPLLLSGGVLVLMLVLVSLWVARRVVRPLQALERAAENLGPGDPPQPVPERGPRAVQAAIRAFNAMSRRLLSALDGQRVVMAAVAHDLRSPITALRLRAEFVADAETREKIVATLDDMQTMTEAVIDVARAGRSSEPARLVDLAALTESLCEDLADTGAAVRYAGGASARARLRVTEAGRALRNLLENAARYGGGATVSLEVTDGMARVHVDDEGPGIPADQLEAVFQPFARLETSRSRETGGHGLGLTIARMIARAHGGDVTLSLRAPKGLRATLSIPVSA